MAKTGFLVVIYQDVNPSSPTYNQTREERTQSEEFCPTSAEANWIEDTKYCELTENGMLTGYEITVYRDVEPLSSTYNQTREEKELNLEECEADETTPNWQNIGDPFCRQKVYLPGGLMGNDGYMIQQQQDMNEYSETADEIREIETLDLTNCPLPNTLPDWEVIYEACHIVKQDGQLMFDGTKDVVRIDRNQYSPSWNNNVPETVNIEDLVNCPPDIEVQYRWVGVSGEYMCVGYDKHSVEKKQRSTDGETWVDVMPLQTRAGALIEANSEDCGYEPTIEYRWVVVDEQYICVGFDKHAMEKKQQSSDGGTTWTDVTPTETRAGELLEANSEDCGYQPTFEYRWVVITGQYECVGYDKYSVEKKQQSSDGGQNWTDVEPLQTRTGSLIERNSTDCGYLEPQYRWVAISGTFVCVGYDKHQQEKQQVSYDNGTTWEDVVPANTRTGSLIEHNSDDCGYVPETVYRWVTISDEYMCVGFDKHAMEKKQQSVDGGTTWTDVVPTETRAGELVEANSEYCGYTDFTTFDCGIIFTDLNTNDHHFSTNSGARFELLSTQVNNANGYIRVNFRIHIKKNMSNYDWVVRASGGTMAASRYIGNVVKGQVITDYFEVPCGSYNFMLMIKETISDTTLVYAQSRLTYICNDCSQTPVYTTRWVIDSVDYMCNGFDKYALEREQYYQNDEWWYTSKEREGALVESNSEDCGYVPPTPPTPSEFVDLQTDTIRICRNTGEYGDYQNQCFIAPNGTITTNLTRVKLSVWFNKDEINYITNTPPCTWMLGQCKVSGAKYVTSTGQWSSDSREPYRTLTHYDPDAAHSLNTVVFYIEGEPGTSCQLTVNFYCNSTVQQVNKSILTINFTENECRWTPIEGQYVCDGFDKYAVEKNQENINGVWTDITPLETRTGSLIETNSEDCGFIPNMNKYLTVESLADNNNITFTRTDGAYDLQRTIYVSTDNGAIWTSKSSGYSTPTVLATLNTGDKLLIKGTNNSYGTTSKGNVISSTDRIIIYGNIMSLKYGDNFIGETAMASAAFVKMFSRNPYLISAENLVLPSTTMATYCYYGMFWNCSSLVKAPELPATTLADSCYNSMFEGCISLETAPELPATTLVSNCYSYMFNGCTSLNYIYAMFTTTPSTSYTNNWVKNVAESGTFVKSNYAEWDVTGVHGIPTSWTVQSGESQYRWITITGQYECVDYDKHAVEKKQRSTDGETWVDVIPLRTRAGELIEANSDDCGYQPTIEYRWVIITGQYECVGYDKHAVEKKQQSVDGGEWTDVVPTETRTGSVIEYNSADCGYDPTDFSAQYLTFEAIEDGTFTFTGRNSNALSYSLDDGNTWTALASGTASPTVTSGNKIMWKGTCTPDSSGIGRFSSTGTFNAYGNTMSIVYGDDFKNSTVINNAQFHSLFRETKVVNTENLVLPSTKLASYCYQNMFYGCTSLTSAPELPATTLSYYCYYSMFDGCTSLTAAPELPATTLTSHCYNSMFSGCTSLVTAPELPATTLTNSYSCYSGMFYGCTSLTTAPELPATTLTESCYFQMFSGCTSLTTAPVLPATTLAEYCYEYMFQGCTSLTTAPALSATTLANRCYGNMFNGCTSLVTAPELPSTTLTQYCYEYMFKNCTSLTSAPELPATTLRTNCYQQMFYGCTKLNYIKAMFTTTPGTSYTKYWVKGVALSGTFVKNSAATWNVTGDNGIPKGWTVVTE